MKKILSLQKNLQSLLITGLSIFALSPAFAADSASDKDDWEFGGSFYLWGAGVEGTSSAGDEVDVSFSDILKELDGALMGGITANKGKWMLLADFMALRIHQETSITGNLVGNPNDLDTDMKLTGYISTFAAGYRVIDSDMTRLNLLVGGRYFYLDSEFEANDGITELKYSDSGTLIDGIVGAQFISHFDNSWYLTMYADVGAGDSKLTWQVWPFIGYKLATLDVALGYRYQKWESDNGDSFDDLAFKGPMLGLKFKF